MRVGIDISPIREGHAGVGAYCVGLLDGFAELARVAGNDVPRLLGFATGLHRPRLPDRFHALPVRWLPAPTRACYAVWDRLGRPRIDAVLGGLDIVHGTNYTIPPARHAKRVATVHDLAFLLHPEWANPRAVRFLSQRIRNVCTTADHVIACSKTTRRDILRLLDVPETRVSVAHEGVDARFRAMPRDQAQALVTEELGIAGPYFLFVGTIEPRKNLTTLARAFASVRNDLPHRLVICGAAGWHTEPILEEFARLGDRLVRPGYVPGELLPALYAGAAACVIPSWYEGFGLTAIEAMASGCPVAASTGGSLPEVTGDAALLTPPEDEAGWADALRRLASDEALRERLSTAGIERARSFTWRACAERTLAAYRQALDR